MKTNNLFDNEKISLSPVLKTEGDFIEVRQVRVQEALRFKKNADDESAQFEELKKLLSSDFLVDHSFTNEKNEKATNEEVAEFLIEKSPWTVSTYVMSKVLEFMFRDKRA